MSDVSGLTRVVLRPVGTPLPLGMLGLFSASLLLSARQLAWVPSSQQHLILLAVLVFSAPLQAVSCVFGFLGRDLVAATGMGVVCVTWAATAAVGLNTAPGATAATLGVLLLVAAGALLVPTLAAATSKGLAAIVLGAAALRFAASGAYQLTASSAWQHVTGIAGIVVAGLAGYAALAFELESGYGHTILPTLRRKAASRALSGSLADQVAGLQREAGVREEL